MPFCLDIGSVSQSKTHSTKNLDGAVEHLSKGMETSHFHRRSGKRHIDVSEGRTFLRIPQSACFLFDRSCDRNADLVQYLPDDRALLFPKRFHLFAPGGNASVAAQIANPNGIEGLVVRGGIDFA